MGSCAWPPERASRSGNPKGSRHEHRRHFHPPAGHDDARHDRDPPLRDHGIPAAARVGPAERRLPHDPGLREPARRIPRDHGVRRGDAARETVHDDRGPRLDDVELGAWFDLHHAAVQPHARPRRRGPGRPGRHRGGRAAAAAQHADAADVPEGEPRGLADSVSLSDVDDAAPFDPRRVRADDDGAAHLDGSGSRPGAGVRVAEVRGTDPAGSEGARRPRHRDRRGGPGRAQRQRQPADRDALWQAPVLHRGSRRPAHPRRGLRTADRDLPQRRARAHPGHRPLHRQCRERQDRRLERHGEGLRAHDHARHSETTRHEHGRDRRQDPHASPDLPEAAARGREPARALRPLDRDPRVRRRRPVHAASDARARRHGHLPLPEEHLRDGHPEPRSAALDRRHLRRDVPARVQPGQSLADGPDAVGRLRRGRRHRHAREHRPPHGKGRETARSGVQGIEGDRLHDHLDDHLPGRRVHPHPLHGRDRRPALPRVCRHDLRRNPNLRLRVPP